MATQNNHSEPSGLDLIKSIPEVMALWQELELYKLLYGEIKDTYGKVDTKLALKSYKENEGFQENFGRYMEALRIQLDKVTTTASPDSETILEVGKNVTNGDERSSDD